MQVISCITLSNISLVVEPLCTVLISALYSLGGSRHNITFPFGMNMDTKLLHHSDVSSRSRGTIIYCFFILLNSSLNIVVICMLHICRDI